MEFKMTTETPEVENELLEICRSESVGAVNELLEFFLYECELDHAPSYQDVRDCRDILRNRGGRFERLAKVCEEWLRQNSK